jgi:hypothetical protein
MVMVAEMVVTVEDVVASVVMVGLVVTVEVALVDEVMKVMTGQNFFNGLDVSDLTQNFTDEERRILVYNGGQLSHV